MDWAKDQLGKLVHAAGGSLFSYGYTCPTCGQHVRRRAGQERRPHFAHYSHSANPDCEYYHPSTNEAFAIATRVWERTPASFETLSLRGGVFLERTEGGRFSLVLKLPRLKSAAGVSGKVEIRSGLGVRSYTAAQLLRPQFVPVIPRLPLVEVVAVDQLADARAAIEEDVSLFRASGNIFRAGSESGRLLAPEEPVEWGEVYRIFTQRPLPPAPSELSCAIVAQGGTQGWFLYETELPPDADAGSHDSISRYLGRAVRHRSARVFLIDPPAHHIDPDGTYVYPSFPDRVLLRRSGSGDVRVEGTAKTEATRVEDHNEWIEVLNLSEGELVVLVDGRTQLSARVDDCDLFRPHGVQMSVGEGTWELFETGLKEELERYTGEALAIQCSSSRVADGLHLSKEHWTQRGANYYLKSRLPRPEIDANNFGSIAWPVVVASQTLPQMPRDRNLEARKQWLDGVVARAAGGRAFEYAGNDALLYRELPWLYPYLRLAQATRTR